jgi:hypothetical protein
MKKFIKPLLSILILIMVMLGTMAAVTAADKYEPDNSRAAAQNFLLSQTQVHTIYPAGDVDWMRFAPPYNTAKYKITVTAVSGVTVNGEVWVKLGLLPEVKLSTLYVNPGGTLKFLFTPSSGTAYYKVGLWASSRTAVGSYSISITKCATAACP